MLCSGVHSPCKETHHEHTFSYITVKHTWCITWLSLISLSFVHMQIHTWFSYYRLLMHVHDVYAKERWVHATETHKICGRHMWLCKTKCTNTIQYMLNKIRMYTCSSCKIWCTWQQINIPCVYAYTLYVTGFAKTILLGTRFLATNFDFKGWNGHESPFLLNKPYDESLTKCSGSLLILRKLILNKVSVSYVRKKHTL